MIGRLIGVGLICAAIASGTYTYDSADYWNYNSGISSRWNQNGSAGYSGGNVAPHYYYAMTFQGSGGSLISIPAISGANSNDYEVMSTLGIEAAGGTYIHFFRTSSPSVVPGVGSYLSAEILVPSNFQTQGAATLYVNQCVNGTVTQLGSTQITASDGMNFRTIIFGTNLWIFINNVPVLMQTIPAGTGNPGIGGYGQQAGSGFTLTELGPHDTAAPGVILARTVASSVFPTSASLKWQGAADDVNGAGVFGYQIARNGVPLYRASGAEFADSGVQPATTYTYTIQAVDFMEMQGQELR